MHKEKKKPMTISLRIGNDETVPDSEQPSKRQIYNVIESFKKKRIWKWSANNGRADSICESIQR